MSKLADHLNDISKTVHSVDKRLAVIETKVKHDEDLLKKTSPRLRKIEQKVFGTQIAFGIIVVITGLFISLLRIL